VHSREGRAALACLESKIRGVHPEAAGVDARFMDGREAGFFDMGI
jgi:hypothetical protein